MENQNLSQQSQTASVVPTPFSEIPKASQIFKESWVIYKNKFKILIGINFINAICPILFSFLIVIGAATVKDSANSSRYILDALEVIAFFSFFYIILWTFLAQLFVIKEQSAVINFQEAFGQSEAKIWAFITTSLLGFLAVLGGMILLIIPGIIFSVWLNWSPFIVIEEDLKNSKALERSKYYVKGRTGNIFGKLAYIFVIEFAIQIVYGIILVVLQRMSGLSVQTFHNYTSWINSVFYLLWTPLVIVYFYQVYRHLKATASIAEIN